MNEPISKTRTPITASKMFSNMFQILKNQFGFVIFMFRFPENGDAKFRRDLDFFALPLKSALFKGTFY